MGASSFDFDDYNNAIIRTDKDEKIEEKKAQEVLRFRIISLLGNRENLQVAFGAKHGN